MANKPDIMATKPAIIVINGCTCEIVSDAAAIETVVLTRAWLLSCCMF